MREGIPNPENIILDVLCLYKIQDADDVAAAIAGRLRAIMVNGRIYIGAGESFNIIWCHEPDPGE